MELEEAIRLIHTPRLQSVFKTAWADFGSGSGLFTRALASILEPGSTIYVVDKSESALNKIQPPPSIVIQKVVADFTRDEMNFQNLDGILMANSLHFVEDKISFLRKVTRTLKSSGFYLIVEYDMDKENPWVPFPISFLSLQKLFQDFGSYSLHKIYEIPSRYNRANIYSAIIGVVS